VLLLWRQISPWGLIKYISIYLDQWLHKQRVVVCTMWYGNINTILSHPQDDFKHPCTSFRLIKIHLPLLFLYIYICTPSTLNKNYHSIVVINDNWMTDIVPPRWRVFDWTLISAMREIFSPVSVCTASKYTGLHEAPQPVTNTANRSRSRAPRTVDRDTLRSLQMQNIQFP